MHCHVQLKQTRGDTLYESYGRAAGQATLSCRGSRRTLGSGQGQASPAPPSPEGLSPAALPIRHLGTEEPSWRPGPRQGEQRAWRGTGQPRCRR